MPFLKDGPGFIDNYDGLVYSLFQGRSRISNSYDKIISSLLTITRFSSSEKPVDYSKGGPAQHEDLRLLTDLKHEPGFINSYDNMV